MKQEISQKNNSLEKRNLTGIVAGIIAVALLPSISGCIEGYSTYSYTPYRSHTLQRRVYVTPPRVHIPPKDRPHPTPRVYHPPKIFNNTPQRNYQRRTMPQKRYPSRATPQRRSTSGQHSNNSRNRR